MCKRSVHLIPAALLCLNFACSAPQKKEEFPSPTPPKISSTEELPPVRALIENDGDYWDTSNVDISDVDKTRKLISFTFDDAPGRTLENILALFASFNENNPDCKATATFFFNGKRLDEQNIHLLYAACAMGFELGNHTHSHKNLTELSSAEIKEEIARTDEALSAVDGKRRHLLRAPFGKVNEEVRQAAFTPLIDWTIDTLDWTGISAEDIYSSVWEGKYSGAIVLMHDGYAHTMAALKRLLPDLKEAGYQAVSLSKMIKVHGCRFEKGKVYIRARKR